MGLVQVGETVDEEDIMPASATAVGSGNGGSAADARGAADADAAGNAAMPQTATDGKPAAEWAAHGDAARGLAGADAERCVLCEAHSCIAQDQIVGTDRRGAHFGRPWLLTSAGASPGCPCAQRSAASCAGRTARHWR